MGHDRLVLSILDTDLVAGRVACRDRIVVSTLHCGCSNLGSNPSLGTIVLLPSDLLFLPSRRTQMFLISFPIFQYLPHLSLSFSNSQLLISALMSMTTVHEHCTSANATGGAGLCPEWGEDAGSTLSPSPT